MISLMEESNALEQGDLEKWNRTNIGETFNGTEMRKLLIRAAFQQAKEDGVTLASFIGAVLMSPLIPMIF